MPRVPTTASYNLYMSRINATQGKMNDLNYQALTGERYDSYDKYGLSSYRLLTLETEQTNVSKYLESNKITQVNLESKEKAINSIRKTLLDFRNELRDFSSKDLKNMAPDYTVDPPNLPTEEDLQEIQRVQTAAFEAMSQIAYFLNTKVDGVYLFGGGNNNTPPVDFPYKSLEDFQKVFDGDLLNFPMSSTADLTSLKTLDSITGGLDFSQGFITAQGSDFQLGTLAFDGGNRTLKSVNGAFSGYAVGDVITFTGTGSNNSPLTIKEISADGSTITFDDADVVVTEVIQNRANLALVGLNDGVNPPKTGEEIATTPLVFDSVTDPVTGKTTTALTSAMGSFLDLQAGGEINITGTGANDGLKIIKSISADGSTITFEEGTVIVPETIANPAALGAVTFDQSTMEGAIKALNPLGTILSTLDIDAAANNLTVDTVANTLTAANNDTFKTLKVGSTITLDDGAGNVQTLYVKGISADGRTLTFSNDTPITGANLTAGTVRANTHSDIHGFISDAMKGSALQTGDIGFDAVKNQMTGTVMGAFSHLTPGGTIIISGADPNNGAKYIESVSADGRTVTFSDKTPVQQTIKTPPIANGSGVTIARTYPVGATLDLGNISPNYDGKYTILGVSDDGNSLIVKTDRFPEYGTNQSFNATSIQSVKTDSYYQGGSLSTEHRIDENSKIELNVTAQSSGFEKLFRAMGNIAQGSLLDMRDPLTTLDFVDEKRAFNRVNSSLDLLDQALESRPNSKEPNGDITGIHYGIVSKLDTIKSTIDNQTSLFNSLTNYVGSIKNVDKKEAVTMLLQEAQNLEVSYSALARINQLSLLNFL